MRFKGFLTAVIAAATVSFAAASPAAAFHFDRPDQPAGWDRSRTVRHWVYYPRYHHVYLRDSVSDPYAYRYVPRGYYPYYNSGYWRRPYIDRAHFRLPKYYRAWGSSKRGYHHVEWHRRHYGGHRRGNW
ncbi:MAG: hypothetical protein KDJ17_12155 [Hyphomicrobiaceae bacterium]|nr:hypothetical protein [Hyphomicrobiaceae bacterium]